MFGIFVVPMLYQSKTTMPSIKILLRTSKVKENGESPIVIRTIKDRKPSFIYTKLYCKEEFWDFKNEMPNKKHPNHFELRVFITNLKADAEKSVLNLEGKEQGYSGNQLKKEIKGSTKKTTVFEFMDNIICDLKASNKIGNAYAYSDCKRALSKFRNEADLSFNDIDLNFLNRYEKDFLKRGVNSNSISFYMRTLRAVFNQAIADGCCKKENYPFEEYKISKLDTTTVKRSLTRQQMDKIVSLEVIEGTRIYDAKNYFLFSYFTRGMNFIDMAKLKWSDIEGNRLNYIRSKTGKPFNMEIMLPVMNILEYYRPFTASKKSNYIFPILNKEVHIKPAQILDRVKKVNKSVNKELKEIAKKANVEFNLTTYVARHSYATIMKRIGASTSIISESLGHDSEKTTQIYLDSFENKELDEANRALL